MERLPHVVVCVLALVLASGTPQFATNKLSPATWGSFSRREHKGPGTYAYGYDIADPVTGNVQFRREEKHANGTVTGVFGHVDAAGVPQLTRYVSDAEGYRVVTSQEEALPLLPPTPSRDATPSQHSEPPRATGNSFIRDPPPLIYQINENVPRLSHRGLEFALPYVYVRK